MQVNGIRASGRISLWALTVHISHFLILVDFPNFPWPSWPGTQQATHVSLFSFRVRLGAAGSSQLVSGVPFIHVQVSKGRSGSWGADRRENWGTARWHGGGPGYPWLRVKGDLCHFTQAQGTARSWRPTLKMDCNQNSIFTSYSCNPRKSETQTSGLWLGLVAAKTVTLALHQPLKAMALLLGPIWHTKCALSPAGPHTAPGTGGLSSPFLPPPIYQGSPSPPPLSVKFAPKCSLLGLRVRSKTE